MVQSCFLLSDEKQRENPVEGDDDDDDEDILNVSEMCLLQFQKLNYFIWFGLFLLFI